MPLVTTSQYQLAFFLHGSFCRSNLSASFLRALEILFIQDGYLIALATIVSLIWLFCTIHWLCGVNSLFYLTFLGGVASLFSDCPIENKIVCADHLMLNSRPPSSAVHTHTIILGSNHRKSCCSFSIWHNCVGLLARLFSSFPFWRWPNRN